MRVENGCMPGTPDLNICHQGNEFWVELKQSETYPKRETTRVFGDSGLRPDQILWINQRTKQGGKVYIIAKVEKDVYCLEGKHASQFNEMTKGQLQELTLDYRSILSITPLS
jgi:penicillin-binding protein-related factor A (putative recombinase)